MSTPATQAAVDLAHAQLGAAIAADRLTPPVVPVPPIVPPSPVPVPPSGPWTVIAGSDWDVIPPTGWKTNGTANLSLDTGQTRINFKKNMTGGGAPLTAFIEFPPGDPKAFRFTRLRVWLTYSPNWAGPANGTNKIVHLYPGNPPVNSLFLQARARDSQPLALGVGLQGCKATAVGPVLSGGGANLMGGTLVRGQEHYIELTADAGDGTTAGSVLLELDGKLVMGQGGIIFPSNTVKRPFCSFQLSPTWGDVGDVIQADQYLKVRRVEIAGHN